MITLIVGLVVGGAVGLVTACMFAARSTSWWRGRAEEEEYLVRCYKKTNEHLQGLICELAKHYPIKLWDELTPALRDECMRIIEQSYRSDL